MTVSKEDLQKIFMLRNVKEGMLDKLASITEMYEFKEGDIVYEKGKSADCFYMLKRGKVLLEIEVGSGVVFTVSSIKPGYSFGWSALLPDSVYAYNAICAESCALMAIPREELLDLMEQDCGLGYVFMHNMVGILKGRVDSRTMQLLKILTQHPEFENFLEGRGMAVYLFKFSDVTWRKES